MKLVRFLLLPATAAALLAQAPAEATPMKLEKLLDFITFLPNPTSVFEAIQRTGIDFPIDEKTIGQVIGGARQGKQSDTFTAQLVLELIHACAGCRDRFFGPLDMEDLLSLINRSLPNDTLINEVRLRGTKNIPPTEDSLRQLRLGGARPDLIALVVPDSLLEVPVPPGHLPFALTKPAGYSATNAAGVLEFEISVLGSVELVFVNNALFYRPVTPTSDIGARSASANAPAPAQATSATLSAERDDGKGKFSIITDKSKGISKPVAESATKIVGDRNGLRIRIDETDKKQGHIYRIKVQWSAPAN
jgi:hypothetical protein